MTESIYQWRYVPTGEELHALRTADNLCGHSSVAECGRAQWTCWAWHGTGSQNEYERAASLPKCPRCLAVIGSGK